jgi:hypothetical protein
MKLFAVIDGLAVPGKTDDERRAMVHGPQMQYTVEPYTSKTPKRAIIGLFPNEHVAKWLCDERNSAHKTYQQAAKEAVMVQDACNMGGVSISFREAVQAVQRQAHLLGRGTSWIRSHPILVLFIDKMNDLCGRPGVTDYVKASDQCDAIARGEEIEYEKAVAA